MIRFLDIFLSLVGLVILFPAMVLILALCFVDTGSPLFVQLRVGHRRQSFNLFKFRTMYLGTESIATHLNAERAVTKLGRYLRHFKLDELPQLWNVLKGDMSLVGPRPCLLNQLELIAERTARGVFDARPGITGLAQINGIDMSEPKLLARLDALMLRDMRVRTYLMYIVRTVCGGGRGDYIPPEKK